MNSIEAACVRPGQGTFREALKSGGIVLFDGAMGTMLYAKGVFIHRAFEELNVVQPARVREVHEAYVAAGAQVIETNTYAANRFRLSSHGLADKVEEINRSGVEIARSAASGRAWVAGSIGPLGVRIEPFGSIAREEARAVFAQQARALVEAGVDLLVLETFSHLPEIEDALRAVREVTDLPVVALVTVSSGGVTREGVSAAEAAMRLAAGDADAVGVNCSDALATLEALERMRSATRLPLCGMPNAGQPRNVDGRNIYLASPDYVEAWARRALRSGVRLIGGCCGTTPEHIRALRGVVVEPSPEIPAADIARSGGTARIAKPAAACERSRLSRAIAEGRFVTGAEIHVPRGWVVDPVVAAARRLGERGATFVGLPEGRADGARVPPLALAQFCRDTGIEPLVHYSCRGRRLARMQSELLGAFALGVTNLLLVTGDPINASDDPVKADLEVVAIGAVNLVDRLNEGQDVGDNPIGRPTGFFIGCRVDVSSYDLERELSRYRWKVEAGAEFALTSPIFEPASLVEILRKLPGERIPFIATIWPLRSATEAEFFEQEMASVPVPRPIVERMRAAEARGTEKEEGLAIAREVAAALRPHVQGIQVVASADQVEDALSVLDVVRRSDQQAAELPTQ